MVPTFPGVKVWRETGTMGEAGESGILSGTPTWGGVCVGGWGLFLVLSRETSMRCRHCFGNHSHPWKTNELLERCHCWEDSVIKQRDHTCFFLSLGRALYRYTRLSCKVCEEGMVQVFHDLLKETHCCTDKPLCNTGHDIVEKSVLYGEDKYNSIHDDISEN